MDMMSVRKEILLIQCKISHLMVAIKPRILCCGILGAWILLNSGCDSFVPDTASNAQDNLDSQINSQTHSTVTEDPNIEQTSKDEDGVNTRTINANTDIDDGDIDVQAPIKSDDLFQKTNELFLDTQVKSLVPDKVVSIDNNIYRIQPQVFSVQNDACYHFPSRAQTSTNIATDDDIFQDILSLLSTMGYNTGENTIDLPVYSSTHASIHKRAERVKTDSRECQYASIQVFAFDPETVWIEDIIWRNVASIMRPQLLLDELAKINSQAPDPSNATTSKSQAIVKEMLSTIAYNDRGADRLPLAQLMVMNIDINDSHLSEDDTAYLTIHSIQKQDDALPALYYQRIIMLDMSKQKLLNLEDVLIRPNASTTLLELVQRGSTEWEKTAKFTDSQISGWPLHLAKEWYLSSDGLHLIYQPGEIISDALPITDETNQYIIDIAVPPTVINNLLKPEYKLDVDEVAQAGDSNLSAIEIDLLPIIEDDVIMRALLTNIEAHP